MKVLTYDMLEYLVGKIKELIKQLLPTLPLAVEDGGTGATNAEDALENLGIHFATEDDLTKVFEEKLKDKLKITMKFPKASDEELYISYLENIEPYLQVKLSDA